MLDKNILLRNLRELASEELQKKFWVYGDANQMSSFSEAICGVFDDAKLTRALESGYLENHFSKNLCQKVKKLDQIIKLIPENLLPVDILKHPQMDGIRSLSGELLGLFEIELE